MRRRRLILFAIAVFAGAVGLAVDRLFPPDLSRYEMRSAELRDEGGATLHVSVSTDGMWRLASGPQDVDPRYLALLIATEDRRFPQHLGVDPIATLRAAWQLATHGHIVSGASTLTMQTVRLLMPHRHDLAGKLLEMARAVQLELHYSKHDILAMYLTLAPYGGNIEGVRAASLAYFEHGPEHLSDAEAALLVALPQSPTRLRPDRHPDAATFAAQRILERAGIDVVEVAFAPIVRHKLPSLAPHLAERLATEPSPVATTLDAGLQKSLEALADREMPWIGGRATIAALVVRNADRAALAYLGGEDFFLPGGMVDMVRAHRSPGSALKPFIYGLAFDDAAIVPDTLIDDAPLRIGDYAPRNFDRDFHGTVTAREALQQSYNLPAVALLNRIGPARFVASLRQTGVRLDLPSRNGEPGLAVALGGLAISLEDLTQLYVALADGGKSGKLRLLATDPPTSTTALMTEASAQEIGAILRDTPRPDGVSATRRGALAYKTGTSYGFRDAWAAGFSNRYTVAVWVGRVEGTPRPGAFGINTAAPLLFHIFDFLQDDSDAPLAKPAEHGPIAPMLSHFAPPGLPPIAALAPSPRIVFPPPDASLDVTPADGAVEPIALEASGGVPPYRWAVNGVPVSSVEAKNDMSWRPDGPGFARISVTDAYDHSASEEIRLVTDAMDMNPAPP